MCSVFLSLRSARTTGSPLSTAHHMLAHQLQVRGFLFFWAPFASYTYVVLALLVHLLVPQVAGTGPFLSLCRALTQFD